MGRGQAGNRPRPLVAVYADKDDVEGGDGGAAVFLVLVVISEQGGVAVGGRCSRGTSRVVYEDGKKHC